MSNKETNNPPPIMNFYDPNTSKEVKLSPRSNFGNQIPLFSTQSNISNQKQELNPINSQNSPLNLIQNFNSSTNPFQSENLPMFQSPNPIVSLALNNQSIQSLSS